MQFADFSGAWILTRTIDDRRAGAHGTLTGHATILGTATECVYSETGQLLLGAQSPVTATRRYVWVSTKSGMIEVRFADGRFFHRIDLRLAQPRAAHDCAPDRYAVRYDFTAWPIWRSEWCVRGPRKHYRMTSAYRPAGQAAESAASQGRTA